MSDTPPIVNIEIVLNHQGTATVHILIDTDPDFGFVNNALPRNSLRTLWSKGRRYGASPSGSYYGEKTVKIPFIGDLDVKGTVTRAREQGLEYIIVQMVATTADDSVAIDSLGLPLLSCRCGVQLVG